MTVIRGFTRDDIDFALRQKQREGWAHSRKLLELLLAHDPDGCFAAESGGRPVGMVTTTFFGASGWIGNLIVEPGHRSRGIGRALMEHGLDRLRSRGTTTVRLDGDPPGIPLYRSLGFVDELDSLRFVLTPPQNRSVAGGAECGVVAPSDLDEVAELDTEIFGADRRRFLELHVSHAELAVVRRRGRRVVAYLMAFPTDRGLRIGPSVAATQNDARCLIEVAVAAAGRRPLLIGLPALNTVAIRVLNELGFEETPSCLRMRLGPAVGVGDPSRVVAISSGAAG